MTGYVKIERTDKVGTLKHDVMTTWLMMVTDDSLHLALIRLLQRHTHKELRSGFMYNKI